MLQLFRNFFRSKLGIGFTLGFLGLIAVAFAAGDIANFGTFGGVAGGDRVATAGRERIDAAELSMNVTNAMSQIRQEQPTLTMEAFVAGGGLNEVLDQMLRRSALAEFARRNGLRAGDRLIDSEIVQLSAFRGPDGNFNQALFRSALAQQGISERALRRDMELSLLARQLVTPVSLAPIMPESLGRRYAALMLERREGSIALLPNAVFAPEDDPTQEQLQAFYDENRSRFIRPERRVIRFVEFGEEALGELPAPSDAQIEERYERDRADYAAQESRRFTQLVVPTEAAAQAIIDDVSDGGSLEQAAQDIGLRAVAVGPVTEQELAATTSAAVAAAGFAAEQGSLATPARGSLGWYVLHVAAIERRPARPLAEARGEIAATLVEEQRRAAFTALADRIEEELDDRRSLPEVAAGLDLEVVTTRPATADGAIYDAPGETLPVQLAPILETAFLMEESEPQLAETRPGETYMIFDVADITSSAVAPLAEIEEEATAAWRRERGGEAARAAAERVMQRVADGDSLADAIAAEETELPAPSELEISREELVQQGQVPAPLALFFSMAQGTVKRLEDPTANGWYVVQLDAIEAGEVESGDPTVLAALQQLGPITGEEYLEQFIGAVGREVGVSRNQPAIDAVAAQLTGLGN